jgi:predicted small lipoprotein YifL
MPSGSLLGISWAGQLPLQTSSGAEAAAELADAGRMAAVSRTARASSVLLAMLAIAGCGEKPTPAGPTDKVFEGIVAKGTTQHVRCNPVGVEVRGEPVVGCSFEEERNESGVMRAVDRCFVVRDGVLIDVTREVPVGTSCAVSSP